MPIPANDMTAPERARPETARPLPRPGLAAELRADEPRRPDLG